MGFTKSVQPYCRLAIIDMQTMPRLSCHQRPSRSETALSAEIDAASVMARQSEGFWVAPSLLRDPRSGEDINASPLSLRRAGDDRCQRAFCTLDLEKKNRMIR